MSLYGSSASSPQASRWRKWTRRIVSILAALASLVAVVAYIEDHDFYLPPPDRSRLTSLVAGQLITNPHQFTGELVRADRDAKKFGLLLAYEQNGRILIIDEISQAGSRFRLQRDLFKYEPPGSKLGPIQVMLLRTTTARAKELIDEKQQRIDGAPDGRWRGFDAQEISDTASLDEVSGIYVQIPPNRR